MCCFSGLFLPPLDLTGPACPWAHSESSYPLPPHPDTCAMLNPGLSPGHRDKVGGLPPCKELRKWGR